MRLLLDTCTFLWVFGDDHLLSGRARAALEDPYNEVHLSAASAWEIAVKHGLGSLTLPEPPSTYVSSRRALNGILPLPIDEAMALQVERLPRIHRDPFDRLLVCQAMVGSLVLVTPDPEIAKYPVQTLW